VTPACGVASVADARALLERLVTVIDAAHVIWTDPVPEDSIAAILDAKDFLAQPATPVSVGELDLPEEAIGWARQLLAQGYQDEHIVEFSETGYGLQHPIRCRPNLLGCQFNEWLASEMGPDEEPGRYLMTWRKGGPRYARLASEPAAGKVVMGGAVTITPDTNMTFSETDVLAYASEPAAGEGEK